MMDIIRYLQCRKDKNSNFRYYLKNFLAYCLPDALFRARLPAALARAARYGQDELKDRVNYYNKLDEACSLKDAGGGDFKGFSTQPPPV